MKKNPKEKDDTTGSRTTCRRSPSSSSLLPQNAPDVKSSTVSSDAASSTMQSMRCSAGGPSSSGRTGTVMVPVGQKGVALGEWHHQAKYTDREVETLLSLWHGGATVSEIARTMEIPKSTVWAICHGFMRAKIPTDWVRRKRK